LRQDQNIGKINLEEALNLFLLPKNLGTYNGEEVEVSNGRFGPYVRFGKQFISLPKGEDPLDVTMERAQELIDEKTKADAPIGTYQNMDVQKGVGRFGPFLKWNGMFINVNKKYDFNNLSQSDIETLIDEKLQKVIDIKSSPTASKDESKPPLLTHMFIPSSTTPITTPRAADMKMLESNTKLTQENESLKNQLIDLEKKLAENEKAHQDALVHASEFKLKALNEKIDSLTIKNRELEAELLNLKEEADRRVGMARQVHDGAQANEIHHLKHELHGTKAMLGQLYGTFMNVFGHMVHQQPFYQGHVDFHQEVIDYQDPIENSDDEHDEIHVEN